jgi:predicted RNase H-like nuclease (RuvC/YqgF family)
MDYEAELRHLGRTIYEKNGEIEDLKDEILTLKAVISDLEASVRTIREKSVLSMKEILKLSSSD